MRIDAYNQIAQLYQTGKASERTRQIAPLLFAMRYRFPRQLVIIRSQNRQLQGLQMLGKIRWHS